MAKHEFESSLLNRQVVIHMGLEKEHWAETKQRITKGLYVHLGDVGTIVGTYLGEERLPMVIVALEGGEMLDCQLRFIQLQPLCVKMSSLRENVDGFGLVDP